MATCDQAFDGRPGARGESKLLRAVPDERLQRGESDAKPASGGLLPHFESVVTEQSETGAPHPGVDRGPNRHTPQPTRSRLILRALARRAGIRRWYLQFYWDAFIVFVTTLAGYIPSHTFRRFFYKAVSGIAIGPESTIYWRCRFFNPRGLSIGANTFIGNDAFLDARRGITIGNCVVTGSEVAIYTLQHDIDDPGFGVEGGPVKIDDYVYLGTRSIVLPSIHIGTGAVVMAGAIVTRDVPAYAIVGGVPARFIRERTKDLRYKPKWYMPFQ
jgi:putative colanic acid biosynthesis acetyltransferase WcaF